MSHNMLMSSWSRFRAVLSADQLTALADEGDTLMRGVHEALGQSPSSPQAQAIAAQWLALTRRIYGEQVSVADHLRMLTERAEQGTWGGWIWLRDALEARRPAF
jgi:TipAS antibiotic-recognition protein